MSTMTADLIDPSLPIDKLPATREAVAAKLLHHVELAYQRTASLRDTVTFYLAKSRVYLPIIVTTHFKIDSQKAEQAVYLSTTLDELVEHICIYRGIATDLFQELPASSE